MELWDSYDIFGHKQELVLERDEYIPKGYYHKVIEILTMSKDKRVLITKRDSSKTFPLSWEITGGSILQGETSLQGAKRELFEETGITAQESEFIHLGTWIGDTYLFDSFLLIKDLNQEKIVLQEGETVDFDIIPLDEFIHQMESNRIVSHIYERFNNYRLKFDAILNEKF